MCIRLRTDFRIKCIHLTSVFSFTTQRKTHTVCSNFHPVPLVYETKQLNLNCEAHKNITYYFKSTEHLYQWKKGMPNPSVNKCYSLTDDEESPPG